MPREQRALDAWAIGELGIPGLDLMERAGAGLARARRRARAPTARSWSSCGKGNNGGDGLVVARLLREQGREVRVLLLAPGEELSGDARANFDACRATSPQLFVPEALDGARVIVDAILGTGFAGVPRGPAAQAIDAINDAPRAATPW